MTAPSDPLAFDFGLDFKPASERVKGEKERRREIIKGALQFHVPYLDDCLRAILPNDLIVLGAWSGAGKTEIAAQIAVGNAAVGKTVHMFALEAEVDEIERRAKFAKVMALAKSGGRDTYGIDYLEWYLGRADRRIGDLDKAAEEDMQAVYSNLHTFYRGRGFTSADTIRLFQAVQSQTDLIVLDHLHYIDLDDEDENRALKRLVTDIRDVALGMGKPVLMVVHLRKKNNSGKQFVPVLDDIHGSSDIAKIATRSVMLAPAHMVDTGDPNKAATFMHAPKDRPSGANPLVACCIYDRSARRYSPQYTLGFPQQDGSFDELAENKKPFWAKKHVPWSTNTATNYQARP